MNCPRCNQAMSGGAPHGPWPVQWECRGCGTIVVPHSASSGQAGAVPPGLAALLRRIDQAGAGCCDGCPLD